MSRKKFLDQKLVTEFAIFRALKNKIEKWLEEVRKKFLEQIDSGFECPAGGPFLLVPEPSSSRIDWKDEFRSYLIEMFSTSLDQAEAEAHAEVKLAEIEIAAKARIHEAEENGETKKKLSLSTKPNPSFKGKAAAAIVKKLDSRSERGF